MWRSPVPNFNRIGQENCSVGVETHLRPEKKSMAIIELFLTKFTLV
jgi:hypothetical protein